MKIPQHFIVVIAASILCGCGVSKEEHQKVVNELNQTKQKSKEANQELQRVKISTASLASTQDETDKTVAGLNDDIKSAKTSIANKESERDALNNLDGAAFEDAKQLANAGNLQGALKAYKAYGRDFPSRLVLANEKIKGIEQVLENQARAARNAELDAQQAKWLADAPKRIAEGEENFRQAGQPYRDRLAAEAQAAADKEYNSPRNRREREQARKAKAFDNLDELLSK